MKKSIFYILISIFFSLFSVKAQQIQWASKLIKFSTDLGGKQNSIKRILGKPDAFPQGGSSPNAWMPKNALDGREIVVVGFDNPQTVKQIAVFENLNAGSVVRISVDSGSGSFETVWTRKTDWKTPSFKSTSSIDHAYYFGRKRRRVQEVPNVFNPGIEYAILGNAVANVVAVKVEFNFALLPGQKEIDAIGISDSDVPIEAKINTNPNFDNLPKPEVIALGELNSSCPIVSFDGKKLFFTESTNEKERIFSCSKDANGKWTNAKEEDAALNQNPNYNYIGAIQPNFILKGGVTYGRGTGESGFEFLDNNYKSTGVLKIAAFNNYDETASATITNDQKYLVMALETDFTQGGTDLYFATRKEDGSFGMLQNMGKTINSAADEGAVCLLSDQKTLLFNSNGFSSYGNYDLYVSYRLDDTWKKWSEPINLGNKINSADYEGSPFYDENTEILYFTRVVGGKSSVMRVKISKKVLIQNGID